MPLFVLAGLWTIGRVAMLAEPLLGSRMTSVLDSLFLIALSVAIFREIISGQNWRNLKVASIVAGLAAANIWFHLEQSGLLPNEGYAQRGAVLLLVLMISLIGGRIIPSFTRNTLRAKGSKILPSPVTNTDRITLIITLCTGIAFTLYPDGLLTGILAWISAALHFERLTRWRGLHVLHEPMLAILHLAYLWISVGFALLGASILFDVPAQSAAIHAFTAGAFSTMILSVMTRASRGHTGRQLHATLPSVIIYTSITLAALFRVLGSIYAGVVLYQISTAMWLLAFGMFIVVYWPVLTGPDARKLSK